jgi:murein tripeptide amidase MpaA
LINKQKKKQIAFYESGKVFDYDSAYHNLHNITSELSRIGKIYANVTKVILIGKSSENRDIISIEEKLITRSRVGRYMSVSLIYKCVNGNKILDRYQFVIIPVLNPDGYVYTWETDRNWRKTRSKFNNTHESESCF